MRLRTAFSRRAATGRWIPLLFLLCLCSWEPALAAQHDMKKGQIRRGEYLVNAIGCGDCHSPKLHGMAPDPSLLLSGHPAAQALPPRPKGILGLGKWGAVASNDFTAWAGPWGVSFASNLTPDKDSGLGSWTAEMFVKTIRTGKHLGVGRDLLPPMPWPDFAGMTDADLEAIFAYLQSLKPIRNHVPAPLPPE